MSNKIINNELIYFTGKKERVKDFSGWESSFNQAERLDFLHHYQKAARKWYNDDALDQKACTEEELSEFFASYKELPSPTVRKEMLFDKMMAATAYKEPEYKNLHLYCGTYVDNGALVFAGKGKKPTPCAKIELEEAKASINVAMSIFIPENFACKPSRLVGTAQPARTVEIRSGTLDIAKIRYINTGEVYAFSKDKWEPTYVKIGSIKFGEWNTFSVEISDYVSVSINGEITEKIERTNSGKADNIFFDGGMFTHGEWSVRDIVVDGNSFEYLKNEKTEEPCAEFSEVKLPYAIGGYENADRRLYLTKEFEISDFKTAILQLDTLDPCGKAWLNGELILEADDFMRRELDVSKYLKEGKNVLKLLVEPRPAEVYYYWHRHDDCHNGWFCGEVKLFLTAKSYIKDLRVFTRSTSPIVKGDATVEFSAEFNGKVELFAEKFSPSADKEVKLGELFVSSSSAKIEFAEELELWSTNNPVLYAVRAVISDENGNAIDDFVVETGFRTIEQKNGKFYLNGEKEFLRGALLMQFLPPLKEVPINHNCPSDEQIAMQGIMLKNMNGNLMRLHLLGYGTNDARYARICDRMGLMLIWTTRFIDSLEYMIWDEPWPESELFTKQIEEVINYPSIVIYEGSNEFHSFDLETIDRMYDSFVDAVDKVDTTRLICPISTMYYLGDLIFYSCDGKSDSRGNKVSASYGWTHPRVIRSDHVYSLHCGYGKPWEIMRKQQFVNSWVESNPSERVWDNLLNPNFAVIGSEYAITALPNPTTKEALENEYVESYERPDENGGFGRWFTQEEWRESQAIQAFCGYNASKDMRLQGFDGLTWCCLSSGANNGSYMKPPIDFYGYKKLGFYGLRDAYADIYACKKDLFVSCGTEDGIEPAIVNYSVKGDYNLKVTVSDENGEVINSFDYGTLTLDGENKTDLPEFKPSWKTAGYYTLSFSLEKI